MSNTDLLKKLESLEAAVKEESRKADKGMKITFIVYGVLVLFVIGYTGFLSSALKERATPENMAAMMGTLLENQINPMSKYLKDNVKAQAPIWAAKAVDYTIDMIPQLEGVAKQQIDVLTTDLINEYKEEYMPNVIKFCQENLDTTFKNADIVSDEELAKAVSGIMVEEIERELDQLIDHNFFFKLKGLKKDIDKIATKPESQMNRMELAEKRVIIYWKFLVEHAEVGQSKFLDAVRFASFFSQAFDDLHINLEKEQVDPEQENQQEL